MRTVLKNFWVTNDQLVKTFKELNKDRGNLLMLVLCETAASFKRVTEAHELFLYENAKTIECSIEGIDDDFTEGHNLRYSIKSIQFL